MILPNVVGEASAGGRQPAAGQKLPWEARDVLDLDGRGPADEFLDLKLQHVGPDHDEDRLRIVERSTVKLAANTYATPLILQGRPTSTAFDEERLVSASSTDYT